MLSSGASDSFHINIKIIDTFFIILHSQSFYKPMIPYSKKFINFVTMYKYYHIIVLVQKNVRILCSCIKDSFVHNAVFVFYNSSSEYADFFNLLVCATENHTKYHTIFPIFQGSGLNKGTVRVFSLSVRCTSKINAYVFG